MSLLDNVIAEKMPREPFSLLTKQHFLLVDDEMITKAWLEAVYVSFPRGHVH